MLQAMTRAVSPALARCELTYLERQPIDVPRAAAQHADYIRLLEEFGLAVTLLPAEPDLPDSVFVEDPVVVVDEVAVIANPGAESRRREAESMAEALAPYRRLCRMTGTATLEGGDVLRAGRTVFVGLSGRTNAQGAGQLAKILGPYGYEVRPVQVRGCLHLKSGACPVGSETLLVNREWVDTDAFRGFRLIDVEEPRAANVLPVAGEAVMADGYPKTRAALERAGFRTRTIGISEFEKAEAGVTCLSVIF
jgi:dimethylargininase